MGHDALDVVSSVQRIGGVEVTTTAAGKDRLVLTSPFWRVRYRNGSGVVRDVRTGCRDEVAAQSVAHQLQSRAELVKANVITPAQDAAADHHLTPFVEHAAIYLIQLGRCATPAHVANVRRQLDRLKAECEWKRLADLKADAIEGWLGQQQRAGMSARTANTYIAAASSFASWCVDNNRLLLNPFTKVKRTDEKADRRRTRRALTEDELQRLLAVARQRPLLDKMTVRRGKRKGQRFAKLTDATRQNLEHLGRERELIHKTLVLTGLRLGELASIMVGNLDLDADVPYIVLNAADEKNRQGSELPIRDDLAQEIRAWLADQLKALQDKARQAGTAIPMALPATTRLFYVPRGLRRILDRDLVAAGIAHMVSDPKTGKTQISKSDERGRTIDVHALRHAFASLLSKGGVAPRTAQAAMRHGDIKSR